MIQRRGHFTPQAAEVLDLELKEFADLLRERATREAFSARGEPIEVTASDVKKARDSLITEKKYERLERFRRMSAVIGTLLVVAGAIWYLTGLEHFGLADEMVKVFLVAYGVLFLLLGSYPGLLRRVFPHFLVGRDKWS